MDGQTNSTALSEAIEHLTRALELLDESEVPAAAAFVAHAIDLLDADGA